MDYAIVDIETTGGHAHAACITEIAIIVTDGKVILEQYETLVNPLCAIPYFISKLTGITQEMVDTAPVFEQVAPAIFELLNGKVFVAHNVNFDYSFVNHQLKQHGFELKCKKLCTVRYGKKVIRGLPSYSLGNFCRSLDIPVSNRHRAGGDCLATYYLLKRIFAEDVQDERSKLLQPHAGERNLPLQLDKEQYLQLPSATGVYYFLDKKEKIIYIGKALNIKKRVASHFSGNAISKQRQEFIRNIAYIKYKMVATELMSLILESSEIKKYWPRYNSAQKNFEHRYAIYSYTGQNGYLRLCVEKIKKQLPVIRTVKNKPEGLFALRKIVTEFNLCAQYCQVSYLAETECHCKGACTGTVSEKKYNEKVNRAIAKIKEQAVSFFIIDKGLNEQENSVVAVKDGNFTGMGYVPKSVKSFRFPHIEKYLEKFRENSFINTMVQEAFSSVPKPGTMIKIVHPKKG
jgi:DNA polymerase-3 subunit epsilon